MGRTARNRRPHERSQSTADSVSQVEAKLRIRSMLPIENIGYDPFADSSSMKKFLADLVAWVLAGRIFHRQASVCRGLVQQWIRVDEHEKLDEIERRLTELERRSKAEGSQ